MKINNGVDGMAWGDWETLADADATEAWGAALGRACGNGAVVYLFGDLGAGKTTLCRGLLHGLGHQGNVKSPTYTLVEPYEDIRPRVYHFDLYRLADPEELEFMGIRDYFSGEHLCLVEWPQRGQGLLPSADCEVELQVVGTHRQLRCRACTREGKSIVMRMQQAVRTS
uniref:tRNA (adenosine(37)-N6)-threonylcarbamoyltransferase complex ATPase subunit type 1 TsaE n=1 Tax=Mangrovitalea sediminis TaxID=1982043 RepID=UPI001D0D6CAE|nr:tRNA (adenosine(37)-N6)-threonylcarbamoyltransferase complex ATPase subunit type 1 TsaE [Mangrovitalea sediminis]